ncbi:MAG: heme-binding protein [Ruminococcaceae bacterium]|nr:heme-binding protein [Oscillospiraceae bacterium]
MTEQRLYRIVDAVKRAVRASSEKRESCFNLTTAGFLIDAVISKAKTMGTYVTVAVADANGRILACKSMSSTEDEHLVTAANKAFTAAVLKMSTGQVGQLSADGKALCGIQKTNNGRIETSEGGNPILSCDRVVGGVGVSGADEQTNLQLSIYASSLVDEIIK